MAVPKRRTSKSKKQMRRSHDFLKRPNFSVCPNCFEAHMPHRVCPSCGYYKGRRVLGQEVEEG